MIVFETHGRHPGGLFGWKCEGKGGSGGGGPEGTVVSHCTSFDSRSALLTAVGAFRPDADKVFPCLEPGNPDTCVVYNLAQQVVVDPEFVLDPALGEHQEMSDKLLDGKDLAFYQWDGDLSAMMAQVKADINRVAEEWSEEQRSHCLEETEKSFKMSGQLLQEIAKP